MTTRIEILDLRRRLWMAENDVERRLWMAENDIEILKRTISNLLVGMPQTPYTRVARLIVNAIGS